jgi:outer membrane protein OmpA-like peptidoglycan-associated protein
MKRKSGWIVVCAALLCGLLLGTGYSVSNGEKVSVKGLITGRSGEDITLKTQDSGNLVVVLTDATKVEEPKGLFKVRKTQYGVTELMPGLAVKVEGVGDAHNRVVANKITFSGNALKTAQSIQAGLQPTEQQVQANAEEIATNKENIAANQQAIQTNKKDIQQANQRFNDLTDYDTKANVTVLYANGSAELSPKSKQDLKQLAQTALNTQGYIVEVKGFTSSTGSIELNQKLSMQRAQGVIDYLLQACNVPLRHIVAPGAMGESNPVASNATAEGQAENRRVDVKVLVNKGLQGESTPGN